MAYEIIAFGNGEILKNVFDAIAICLNSSDGTLYAPLIRISLIIGGLWTALYAVYGDYMRAINNWIIPITIIMQLLLVPQATVWIIDPVSRYHQKVDHVPYGLAMIASNISKIGYEITKQIEKVFHLPDDLKYQKTGTLFAANLIQQAKTFRITNEDLAENMRQFVEQCVVYDALIGRKYTIQDLRQSTDLWKLVADNASPVRSFLWRDLRQEGQLGERPRIITCREGVNKFNLEWTAELTKTATLFGKKIFGENQYVEPRAELLKYLPLAYSTLANMAQSAENILKQNMMIYAVVEGIEHKSTSLGNAPNFAVRKAYLQQRSTYETLGAMAAETLPAMKGVLEALAYSAFLFIIPLSILPSGWRIVTNWIQVLVWLQSWAPLYAILNYIMTIAAKAKSIAALSVVNSSGVTIASSVGLANVNADLAAMSGYLSMSIPFLCVAIVKGISSFVSIPGILSNVTQSVAGQASQEAITGNYSMANISQGTQQIANTNMFSQSNAASYRAGSFQHSDGRSDIVTTGNQQVVNVSSSNLPIALNVAEMQSAQLSKQASRSYQKGLQQTESYATNMADTMNKAIELTEHLAKSKQASDQFNNNESIEQMQALNKSTQIIQQFAKDNNLTTTQASEIIGSISVGTNKSVPGKIAQLLSGVSAELKSNLSGSAHAQKIYREAESIANNKDFQDSLKTASQLSHNQSFASHNDEGKRLADSMSQSWNKANSFRQEASKSFNESQAYQQQAASIKSLAASINANYNQEFVDWLSAQKADNTVGHIGKQGAAYIIANNVELSYGYAQRFLAEKNLLPQEDQDLHKLSPQNLRASYNQENSHAFIDVNKNHSLDKMNMLKQQAKFEGLSEVHDSNGLQQAFNEQSSLAKQELNVSKQSAHQEFRDKGANHKRQSKKNLARLALKEEGKQLYNIAKDVGVVISNIPTPIRNIISDSDEVK